MSDAPQNPQLLIAPTGPQQIAPTPTLPPLISSSPATQATAGMSNVASAALVGLLLFATSKTSLGPVPPEVAADVTVLIGLLVHYIGLKYMSPM